MSKGYDSAERETRERTQAPRLCEAYACAEYATVTALEHDYCEAHRPPVSGPGQDDAASS